MKIAVNRCYGGFGLSQKAYVHARNIFFKVTDESVTE